jgi:hypothetical protein
MMMSIEHFKPRNNTNKFIIDLTWDLLDFLNDYSLGNFTINYIKFRENNTVVGTVLYKKRYINIDYMNKSETFRIFTKGLSEELRDYFNSNMYYNIINGKIIFYV